MPVLVVNTNVTADKVPADFKKRATDVVAKSLGKPVAYIAVQVNPGVNMSFGGTDEPAALCDLTSIGALSVESNKAHSKHIMDLLKDTLAIDSSRIYISFHNMPKADIGYSGTTFDDLI